MSGFAGIIRFKGPPLTPEDLDYLKKMSHRLRYRGPHHEKIVQYDSNAAFVFRSSLSLLPAIEQPPIKGLSGNLCLMVSGEIFNHQSIKTKLTPDYAYKTPIGAEVVLPLYLKNGLDFASDLIGGYAISLWDNQKNRLILVRDPIGVKPLFYSITAKGHLIYGSEIKALLGHPDCSSELDWVASLMRPQSYDNLSYPFSSGFKNIKRVDPGSMLVCDNAEGVLKQHQWWSLKRDINKNDKRSKKEVIGGYFDLLREAVHMQTPTDGEAALSLSGGIDSVSVAAFAREVAPIRTFTIHNLSTFYNQDVKYAHEAARYLNLPNHQLYFPWQQKAVDYNTFKEVAWAAEMPINAEQIFKYTMNKKIKENFPHIKILLMGQGSDEFNGGFTNSWIERFNPSFPEEEMTWEDFVKAIQTSQKYGRLKWMDPSINPYNKYFNEKFAAVDRLDPMQYYHEFHRKQVEGYNLWHEDRNSASNSLENRAPFLDHRIVEYLANVPKELHKELFFKKQIIRDAMEPLLPELFRYRPKVYCFAGKAVRYTNRMMYHILADDDYYGLKESILDNSCIHDVIDKDEVLSQFKKLPNDPSYEGIDEIVALASLGLFAKWMVEGTESNHVKSLNPEIDWTTINNWTEDEADLALRMGTSNVDLNEQRVLEFNNDVVFLINSKNTGYFSVKGRLDYILDPVEKKTYIEFLKKIDGKKNVAAILSELNVHFSAIRVDLEEAMEYQLIVIKN